MPEYPRLSSLSTGLRCKCPRCGKGALYQTFLRLRPECPHCGLSYAFADTGDGPAFFVMSGVGIAVMGLFLYLEIAYHPPIWFHLLFTLPLFLFGCLGVLRPTKAWLVSEQYVRKASEAQWESTGKHGPS